MFYCVDNCLSYTNCEAVTYDTENQNCELFIEDQGEVLLSPKRNRVYINMTLQLNRVSFKTGTAVDFNKAALLKSTAAPVLLKSRSLCYSRPCGHGERCIPNKGSYICVLQDPCPSMYLVYGKCGVPVANIIASSGVVPKKFGLEVGNDWCADVRQKHEWLQVRFKSEKIIKEIITRGGRYKENWVESFSVEYSMDCVNFKYLRNSTTAYQEFDGNRDKTTYRHNIIQYRFKALCIRIGALTWHGKICMRLEIVGCEP